MVVIGAGRAGTAFSALLARAGYRVTAVTGGERTAARAQRYLESARFVPLPLFHSEARTADLVLVALPDDLVAPVTADLARKGAFRRGQHVLHLSGSLGVGALDPAGRAGAEVLSMHPLQSFPDVESGIQRLRGSSIAVTARTEGAFALGLAIARAVGGTPFRLADDVKPLYHAAAVFCSNYLVVVEAVAEHLFRLAGLDDPVPLFGPLAANALDASLARGPAAALTGPVARGDPGTVDRNLQALQRGAPQTVPLYIELARAAASLASAGGTLSESGRRAVEEVLERWR